MSNSAKDIAREIEFFEKKQMKKLVDVDAQITLIAALKRITRKAWPPDHRKTREFEDKRSHRVVEVSGENDPLWKPGWAREEYNSCDCSKCIAIRALNDVGIARQEYK